MSDDEELQHWRQTVRVALDAAKARNSPFRDLIAEFEAQPSRYVLSWNAPLASVFKPVWRVKFFLLSRTIKRLSPTELTDTHPLVMEAESLISEWEFGWSRLTPHQRSRIRQQAILSNLAPNTLARAFRSRHLICHGRQVRFKRLGNETEWLLKGASVVFGGLALWSTLTAFISVVRTNCFGCEAQVLIHIGALAATLCFVSTLEGPLRRRRESLLAKLGVTGT
jgi:hypothetical protein